MNFEKIGKFIAKKQQKRALRNMTCPKCHRNVPHQDKEMFIIPEAGHFDLYDLAPFATKAGNKVIEFFDQKIVKGE